MKLSKYFSLDEMTFSQTAVRKGIDNTPNISQVANLTALCVNILDPLRVILGKPVFINSGFRSERLNAMIGGARNSQHTAGMAADINVPGLSTDELFAAIKKSGLPVDQCISEFGRWVHVSYSPAERGQFLVAVKQNGKVDYLPA